MKPPGSQKNAGRGPLRGVVRILSAACLLLLGCYGWRAWSDSEPYIEYPPVPARATPNGYEAYIKAGQAVVKFDPPVDPLWDYPPVRDPRVFAKRYSLARREAWRRANLPASALFRAAQQLPCEVPNTRASTTDSGPWRPSRYFSAVEKAMRTLDYTKRVAVQTACLRGDWNGMLENGLDVVQMGIDLPRGGGMWEKRNGYYTVHQGLAEIENTQNCVTAAEARAAVQRLEKLIARRVSMTDALNEDEWVRVSEFLRETRRPDWREACLGAYAMTFWNWVQLESISKRGIVARIRSENREAVANFAAPYQPPIASSESEDSETPRGPLFVYTRAYGGFRGWLAFQEANEKTALNLCLLRLALRAYIVEHGTAPKRLAVLAPEYLKAVPTDPFANGAPLHYWPVKDRYALWSVGPDGKDDNAKPVAARDGRTERLPYVAFDSTGDWVAGRNR